jgi:hypothetical protein
MGSKASPVQVQCRAGSKWVTYTTLKTDSAGDVSQMTVAPAKCTFGVRLVRPEGANVTSATSATVPVHFV